MRRFRIQGLENNKKQIVRFGGKAQKMALNQGLADLKKHIRITTKK